MRSEDTATNGGFYLYGIVRGRGLRGARGFGAEAPDVQRVRYRDIEAIGRATAYEAASGEASSIEAHQRVLDAIMRKTTVLPAPYGVVFRSRRALIHVLEDQYLALDEGLAFLDGYWELRLHIGSAASEPDHALGDLAMQLFSELRRGARAAIPFAAADGRLLSAAFLVERGNWIEFVERSEDIASAHADLSFDVTGPWPPYDFVRMTL